MAAGDVDVKITSNRALPCAWFDGVNDLISTSNYIKEAVSYFTISLWARIEKSGVVQVLWGKFSGATAIGTILLNVAADRKLRFLIGNSAGAAESVTTDAAVMTIGTWYHILVTWDAGTATIYVNGTSTKSGVLTESYISYYNYSTRIGNDASTAAGIKGSMCNVRYYNRVLSATEIADLAAGRNVQPGLIGLWKLSSDYNDSATSVQGVSGVWHGTNVGTYLTVCDDAISIVVKAQRVGINDKWYIASGENGQVVTTRIEE